MSAVVMAELLEKNMSGLDDVMNDRHGWDNKYLVLLARFKVCIWLFDIVETDHSSLTCPNSTPNVSMFSDKCKS
jgi:hypothetical protein